MISSHSFRQNPVSWALCMNDPPEQTRVLSGYTFSFILSMV